MSTVADDNTHAAVAAFIARKFGQGGTYDPATPGPWKEAALVKGTVAPYNDGFIACEGTVAQPVFVNCGKFSSIFSMRVRDHRRPSCTASG